MPYGQLPLDAAESGWVGDSASPILADARRPRSGGGGAQPLGSLPRAPAHLACRLPDPQHTSMPDHSPAPPTFFEQLDRAERARSARLRSLWQLSVPERIAAMRRGELTYEQLAAWSARHPEQVPMVHGEFEWIIAKTPEAAE